MLSSFSRLQFETIGTKTPFEFHLVVVLDFGSFSKSSSFNGESDLIFSRRFRRKCTTLTVASRLLQWHHDSYSGTTYEVFFRQFNAIGPLFCQFLNIINLNYGRPRHTRKTRASSKTKTSTSRTSKT